MELVKYLFQQPDVISFLSQRLCQDPLENFFGCQRQRGGVHDNPNVQEFTGNTQALRVINSFCRPTRGNSFLSQRLCQDPLENFFGCQRQRGGVHDNPNVQEFTRNTQALRVINSFC